MMPKNPHLQHGQARQAGLTFGLGLQHPLHRKATLRLEWERHQMQGDPHPPALFQNGDTLDTFRLTLLRHL